MAEPASPKAEEVPLVAEPELPNAAKTSLMAPEEPQREKVETPETPQKAPQTQKALEALAQKGDLRISFQGSTSLILTQDI